MIQPSLAKNTPGSYILYFAPDPTREVTPFHPWPLKWSDLRCGGRKVEIHAKNPWLFSRLRVHSYQDQTWLSLSHNMMPQKFQGGEFYAADCTCKRNAMCTKRWNSPVKQHRSIVSNPMPINVAARIGVPSIRAFSFTPQPPHIALEPSTWKHPNFTYRENTWSTCSFYVPSIRFMMLDVYLFP